MILLPSIHPFRQCSCCALACNDQCLLVACARSNLFWFLFSLFPFPLCIGSPPPHWPGAHMIAPEKSAKLDQWVSRVVAAHVVVVAAARASSPSPPPRNNWRTKDCNHWTSDYLHSFVHSPLLVVHTRCSTVRSPWRGGGGGWRALARLYSGYLQQ